MESTAADITLKRHMCLGHCERSLTKFHNLYISTYGELLWSVHIWCYASCFNILSGYTFKGHSFHPILVKLQNIHLAKAATFEQKHFCPTDARNGLKLIGGESFIQIIDRVNEPILLLPKNRAKEKYILIQFLLKSLMPSGMKWRQHICSDVI